jgi:hypothetical protein
MIMQNYLNIDWLKSNHKMIHYFGLGFIQLKIDDQTRIHFYTPELPPIVSQEDIHNHRYDFFSQVLKGHFSQALFNVIDGNTHLREQESCKEGVSCETPPTPCAVEINSEHKYVAGSAYFIKAETFHRVSAEGITLLKRGEPKKDFAEVIRRAGSEKTCPFSQKIEESRLWEIIECMIKTK